MDTTTTARTILGQIPTYLKMALGLRDSVALPDGVQFQVTGSRHLWVRVVLNSEWDAYDVQVSYRKRGTWEFVRTVDVQLITVDGLLQILRAIDSGEHGRVAA